MRAARSNPVSAIAARKLAAQSRVGKKAAQQDTGGDLPVASATALQPVRAKLFQNGRSQAVRLPKEFRFEGKEVQIRRQGLSVVLTPVMDEAANKQYWDERFRILDRYKAELGAFPDCEDDGSMGIDEDIVFPEKEV